jgi:hypothetical protein
VGTSRYPPARTSGGYFVRRASHPTVTSDACLPRLLLVVQQVHFLNPYIRRGKTMTHRAFARIGLRIRCRGEHRNCTRHPAWSAEMKPLTGRDLTVIRSIQCDPPAERAEVTLHKCGM